MMMSRSCLVSCRFKRDLIGHDYLDAQLLAMPDGDFQEPVISGHEPSCRRSFGECKMQRVERAESESGERASPIDGPRALRGQDHRGFQPQPSGQSPVFAWIPFVLEIVSG